MTTVFMQEVIISVILIMSCDWLLLMSYENRLSKRFKINLRI